jgi:formamidopyrimidine-DNA glycosylase
MPELPEVEVLVRHLAPLLKNRKIRRVQVRRARIVRPLSSRKLDRTLRGARFTNLRRRGKYLLFELETPRTTSRLIVVGHLGMTGRMYLASANAPLAKHAAVVVNLGKQNFVFEDTRYFGRFTLDDGIVMRLGPEPLDSRTAPFEFKRGLARSAQAIKLKLLDQALVAGVGNIYASEALFAARISPFVPARRLDQAQVEQLWHAIRQTLTSAIDTGSTIPLDYAGAGKRDGLFYYGSPSGASTEQPEHFSVYDRANQPCIRCGSIIQRVVQGGRSTFYCPNCQGNKPRVRRHRNRKLT